VIKGGSVLLLLSMFFAYLLAPAVDIVSRMVRVPPRGRPLPRGAALALIYALLSVPVALAWRFASEPIAGWVRVTAPAAVEHLFGGGDFATLDRVIASAPVPQPARPILKRRVEAFTDRRCACCRAATCSGAAKSTCTTSTARWPATSAPRPPPASSSG
jgi:hypothetical protein